MKNTPSSVKLLSIILKARKQEIDVCPLTFFKVLKKIIN